MGLIRIVKLMLTKAPLKDGIGGRPIESKIELKPCPFCGVVPELQDFVDGPRDMNALPGLDCKMTYGVCCENEGCPCNPFTDDYTTPQAAAAAWNRRAQ